MKPIRRLASLHPRLTLGLLALVLAAAVVPPAWSQELTIPCKDVSPKPDVSFDHLGQNQDRAYSIQKADGKDIVICIENTDPTQFTYAIRAVEKSEPSGATAAGAQTELKTKILHQVHDKKNGGYIVDITTAGKGEVILPGQQKKQLRSVTLLLSVTTAGWDYELAGGFTVSRLKDPVFGLRTRKVDGVDKQFIVEDRGAADEARLGLGAMIHVFHTTRFSGWAPLTFGLGVNEGNKTTYFAGTTWRFGDKAALTLGYAFGSVKRLPNGVNTVDPVTDSNVLANLGSKVDYKPFISFSYAFLNPGIDKLKKPFVGQDTPSPAASSRPSSPSPAVATRPAESRDTDEDGIPDLQDTDPCDPDVNSRLTGAALEAAKTRDSDGDGIIDAVDPTVCPPEA